MPALRPLFLLALLALAPSCSREPDEKARQRIHAAGYAYSVDDFLKAAGDGREDVVREFLAAGMNPNAAGEGGRTAVSRAAGAGHGHVVALLLAHGATPNAATPEGQTALMAAAESGDAQAVKALLAAGADAQAKNDKGVSPLAAAVLAGHATVVSLLAERAPLSLDHALQLAAVKGHTAVISVLMDRGASPYSTGAGGRTPLMFAALHGHQEAVKLLRQRGASVTALDAELKTAAVHAADSGHDAIAAYLSEPDRSADPIGPDASVQRIAAVDLSGFSPAGLSEFAAAVRFQRYYPRTLPVAVEEVPEGNASVTLRVMEGGEQTVSIEPGSEIPGTGLVVESVERRMVPSRYGQGRMVDASEVVLLDSAGGRRYLIVKGLPALMGEGAAQLQIPGVENPVEVASGDVFTAGSLQLKITEVRPLAVVVEDTAAKTTVTLTKHDE